MIETPEPTDAGLRDRIAAALLARIKQATVSRLNPADGLTSLLAATEFDLADAVLAVLPAPADRAAVIQEVIERLETRTRQAPAPGWRAHSFRDVRDTLVDDLRSLADEAQQPEAEAWPPSVSWRVETRWHDGTWRKYGPSWDTDHDWMKEHFARDSTDDKHAFRLARATTTYTVEAEGAQR